VSRKWFKVGAMYGHCGTGNGVDVYIPIYAENLMQARKRALQMSGLKKRFGLIWHAVEIVDEFELRAIRKKWIEFKLRMWARERQRKRRRRRKKVG
jgi:hypothetical protein